METSTLQILLLGGISISFMSGLATAIVVISALRGVRVKRLQMQTNPYMASQALLHLQTQEIRQDKTATQTQSHRVVSPDAMPTPPTNPPAPEKEDTHHKQVKRITQTLKRHQQIMMPERKIG